MLNVERRNTKSQYTEPAMTVVEFEAGQLIAASLGTTETKADPTLDVLTNERNSERSWGNLWNE